MRTPTAMPRTMKAMVLEAPGKPLALRELSIPEPAADQVLVRVSACGVCRTDLHVVDGELPRPKLPLVLGHQIVGTVVEAGAAVEGLLPGDRIGVPWLGWTDGTCRFCRRGQENLCDSARFTGYTLDGGYAGYAVADHRYSFRLPERYDDLAAAPLLCAGLIGYRAYRMIPEQAETIGFFGFGSSAHILVQLAAAQGKRVFAFTRPGDREAQELALRLGAVWAGPSTARPPAGLDGAILFAPVGALVPAALIATVKGGTVVCAGIHMSDIPSFPYGLLWEERSIRSVANLTRADGEELLALAAEVPIRLELEVFLLEQANEALSKLRAGRIHGSAVLRVAS